VSEGVANAAVESRPGSHAVEKRRVRDAPPAAGRQIYAAALAGALRSLRGMSEKAACQTKRREYASMSIRLDDSQE
jgi:hypothetical protein